MTNIIMTKDATVKLYFNEQNKELLLLRMIYGKIGTLSAWFARGKLLRYKEDEFKEKGWDIVLKVVENTPAFDPDDKAELDRMNSAQRCKYYKAHKVVDLNISSDAVLLWPYKKVNDRGGMEGKEKIVLTLPITNQSFWEKLMEAFEKAD